MSHNEILEYVNEIENQGLAIKKELLRICWHMRGMSYDEALNLDSSERSSISELVKENMEITKKSGLNYF